MKRTILISGGNRGIGKSIAIKALKDGHRISLGVRNPSHLYGSILDPEVSGVERILLNKYEANDELSATNWIKNSINRFGNFDTLVNCAGIFNNVGLNFNNEERKDIDKLIQVNLMGPWLLTRLAWSELAKHGQGRIIVLVSMSGKRSKSNLAGYTVSKFALMGLCETMRNEGWSSGIRVTAICPSWVNTDMAANINMVSKQSMTQPEDIGSVCSKLLELPNSCIPFELKLNCNLEI